MACRFPALRMRPAYGWGVTGRLRRPSVRHTSAAGFVGRYKTAAVPTTDSAAGAPTGCVFCGIVSGVEPATVVAADDKTVAFLPRPDGWFAPGHTLVIPVGHVESTFDASNAELADVIATVKRVAEALRETVGARGVNVMNASGPDSEQSVFHLHFNVLPRWENDGPTTWPSRRDGVRVRDDFADRLRRHLAVD